MLLHDWCCLLRLLGELLSFLHITTKDMARDTQESAVVEFAILLVVTTSAEELEDMLKFLSPGWRGGT